MKSRKLAVLVAACLVWSTAPAGAQTGPNPQPQPAPTAQPATPPGATAREGGLFQSDLVFMLAAIAGAALLAFAATQIGGEDEPVSP